MKLRQIFEGLGQEVAIIFGRFNPPHKGHRAAWELAAKSPIWYVGTNESTVGPKDPLPYGIKVEAMTAIWPEVEGHIIAETSWLTLASLVYEKHGDVTLLCLTDEDWVTKTIQQYNGKEGAHGFYNFKTIKQKPTPRLSSATALRDAVSKGDREAFATAAGVDADTPVAGKPFFDLVAEYLLPYSNAPVKKTVKKTAKKKVAAPVEGIDEGWKDLAIGGAMALGALGAGHSQAADLSHFNTQYLQQVVKGEHPRPMVSIDDAKQELQDRANGKQPATAPARIDSPSGSNGFSKEYLQKAADPDRFGRYMISVEKAQELLNKINKGTTEGIMGFMSSEKPKAKKSSSLSTMRKEFEKEKDEKGPSYMRSKDLPKKPQHVRTVRSEELMPASTFAGSSKYKMGQAGQWRNDGPSKNRPARRGDLVGSTDESEGSPEGLPHLTKEMLQHIVQQVGKEGAHAIIKSLTWGDGAAKELLHLIVNDIEDDIKANDFKQEDAAGVGIITKQNSTVDVNKGTPRKNLKAFKLV
jgi:hypothetical protein